MPLSPYPWISLIVLIAVPVLVQSKSGPSWLMGLPYAPGIWLFLAGVAATGILRGTWFDSGGRMGTSGIALFVAPLVQALIFVMLYRFFAFFARRPPVSFDDARNGRSATGDRHIWDIVFWLVTYIIVLLGVCMICFHFGVEFPSRHPIR